MANFCIKCGTALVPGCKFCPECGANTVDTGMPEAKGMSPYTTSAYPIVTEKHKTDMKIGKYDFAYIKVMTDSTVSRALKLKKREAIVWLIIACMQVVLGLILSALGKLLIGSCILVVACVNCYFSIKTALYLKDIYDSPRWRIREYTSMAKLTLSLLYNLLFGGIIGLIAPIYGMFVCDFLVKNDTLFYTLDEEYADK